MEYVKPDWGIVLTQIIGFLLAMMILKKFAWGPILALLDERRAKIQAEFDKIEATQKDVASMKADLEAQMRTMEAQARVRLQEVVAEGQKVSAEITEKARVDAHELIERARAEILRDRDKARVELRNEMVAMVVQATEKIIVERMDEARHRERIAQFLDALRTVPGSQGSRN